MPRTRALMPSGTSAPTPKVTGSSLGSEAKRERFTVVSVPSSARTAGAVSRGGTLPEGSTSMGSVSVAVRPVGSSTVGVSMTSKVSAAGP